MRGILRFAYLLPALHFGFLIVVCVRNIEDIVPKIGMIDVPLTLLASPVLMNVNLSATWVFIYYLVAGSFLWYFVGKVIDRWVGTR